MKGVKYHRNINYNMHLMLYNEEYTILIMAHSIDQSGINWIMYLNQDMLWKKNSKLIKILQNIYACTMIKIEYEKLDKTKIYHIILQLQIKISYL